LPLAPTLEVEGSNRSRRAHRACVCRPGHPCSGPPLEGLHDGV